MSWLISRIARIGFSRRHVAHHDAGLEHAQHEVRRADLQHGRGLAHVAVADDDVQAAVEVGIGMRLVAGVDDRSRPGGGARHALPHVVSALAQAVDGPPRRLEHLARAADQLPGDEERDEPLRQSGELATPLDEVVLVAAVRVAGRVGVVLEEVDVAEDALVAQALSRRRRPVPRGCARPARSWVTSCVISSHSAVAYSGWLPTSRYRREPLVRKTLLLRPHATTRRNR